MSGHDEFSHPNLITNIIAVIGFVILMLVVLWGLFHLLGLVRTWLATGFTGAARSALTVTLPKTVVTGEPFTASWKFGQQIPGTFSIMQQCDTGVSITFIDKTPLNCGATVPLPSSASTSVLLIATIPATATTTSPFTVIFTPSSTTTSATRVSSVLTVVPRRVNQSAVVTPTPTATTTAPAAPIPIVETASTPAPVAKGWPDLQVSIIGVGVIDSQTGQFVNRPAQYQGEVAAVQFDITNAGSASSGTYYFTAGLPTLASYIYNSEPQAPLVPGDHVTNTLRFTNINPAGGQFTVTVDSFDSVRESNENNNIASQSVRGPGYNRDYYQQPIYGTQQYTQPTYYQQQYNQYQVYVPPQQPSQPSPYYDMYNYDQSGYGDYWWNDYNYTQSW